MKRGDLVRARKPISQVTGVVVPEGGLIEVHAFIRSQDGYEIWEGWWLHHLVAFHLGQVEVIDSCGAGA